MRTRGAGRDLTTDAEASTRESVVGERHAGTRSGTFGLELLSFATIRFEKAGRLGRRGGHQVQGVRREMSGNPWSARARARGAPKSSGDCVRMSVAVARLRSRALRVPVVQPSDPRSGVDARSSCSARLDETNHRRIFLKSQMRAVREVVPDVLPEQATEVPVIEHDEAAE